MRSPPNVVAMLGGESMGELRSGLTEKAADLSDEGLDDARGAGLATELEDLASIARTVGHDARATHYHPVDTEGDN